MYVEIATWEDRIRIIGEELDRRNRLIAALDAALFASHILAGKSEEEAAACIQKIVDDTR